MFLWRRLFHREFTARKTLIYHTGFSLLEVMISLCIFTMGLLALCRLHYLSYELSLSALQHSVTINKQINDGKDCL